MVHLMVPFVSMLRGNPLSCRGNPSGYLKTAAQRDSPIQQVYHSNGDDASCRKTPAVWWFLLQWTETILRPWAGWMWFLIIWHGMVGHFPWTGSSPFDMEGLRKVTQDILHILPSGKRTCLYYKPCSYWTWQFIVGLSIKHGHFPYFLVCLPEGTWLLWRKLLLHFGCTSWVKIRMSQILGSAPWAAQPHPPAAPAAPAQHLRERFIAAPHGREPRQRNHPEVGENFQLWDIYPLVNVYISMENHHVLVGTSTISMAIFNSKLLNYQRVNNGHVSKSHHGDGSIDLWSHDICGNNDPVSIYFRVPRVPGFWPRTMLEISLWIYHDNIFK